MSRSRALLTRFSVGIAGIPLLVTLLVVDQTRWFALVNLLVQLAIFVPVACLPAWRTRRMSYVDIAWPWGLVALGVLTLVYGHASAPAIAVGVAYLVMGGRMGVAALVLWRAGELDNELPRYRFQRKRWKVATLGDERRDLVAETLVQAVANWTALAVPGALAVASPGTPLGVVGLVGLALWGVSWLLESVADAQKLAFVRRPRQDDTPQCCEVGLWRYSRHPNYFFQWMQWNALVLVSLPQLVEVFSGVPTLAGVVLAVGLAGTSACMYWCLVRYTGAVPAEYYSVRKRPAYRDYQARVNMFAPWRPRAAR